LASDCALPIDDNVTAAMAAAHKMANPLLISRTAAFAGIGHL